MYLHLGNNYLIRKDRIIAILDLATAGSSQTAQNLLNNFLKKDNIQAICQKSKAKSIIITDSATNYLSPISSSTLFKRGLSSFDID